jgi:hypothetical protein
MKRTQILGAVFVAVLVVSACAISPALAVESTWLVDGAVPTATQEVDSEWDSAKLSIVDLKGGIFGEEVVILCPGNDLGTIGPGKADSLTSFTITSCELMVSVCPEPLVEVINLPWTSSIVLIGGTFYDDITSTAGTKMVGYNVLCNNIVEDTCEVALVQPQLVSNFNGQVEAVFNSADANQPRANCSRGGTGAGLISGTDLILSEVGLSVAISEG